MRRRALAAAAGMIAVFGAASSCLVFDRRSLPVESAADGATPGDAAASAEGGSEAAIVFVGPAVEISSDRATLEVPVPDGVALGDFLWLAAFADRKDATMTAPTGFTAFADCAQADTDYHAFTFYRVVDAVDVGTYRFAVSSAHFAETAVLARYRGVDVTRLPPAGGCAPRGIGSSFSAPMTEATGSTVIVSVTNDVGCSPWAPAAPLEARGTSADGIVFVGDLPAASAATTAAAIGCSRSNGAGVVTTALLHAR